MDEGGERSPLICVLLTFVKETYSESKRDLICVLKTTFFSAQGATEGMRRPLSLFLSLDALSLSSSRSLPPRDSLARLRAHLLRALSRSRSGSGSGLCSFTLFLSQLRCGSSPASASRGAPTVGVEGLRAACDAPQRVLGCVTRVN
jgi:hypothetical protein